MLPAAIVLNWANESAFSDWEKIKVEFVISIKSKEMKNLPGRVIYSRLIKVLPIFIKHVN